ncbi:hypothetical protein [Erythrobacter sp. Alg231-14]|uniref:hypothetical protein n=1 Tax=Erythrobacter sp. Alg231-14 TaxID=1922225 RepID=UPI000D559650
MEKPITPLNQPNPPGAPELYYASLVANLLVYGAGALIFSVIAYFGAHTGSWLAVVKTLGMFATIGMVIAAVVGFLIVAPMGTAYGLAMLKLSRPAWWQGPVTGALVALSLEAFVIFVVSQEALEAEMGNVVTLSIPVALAMIAGAFVQRKLLHWPTTA